MSFKLSKEAVAEWRRHWPMVIASALGVGLMSVPTYMQGIFIGPLENEFGWSRAAISSGAMLPAITAIFLAPLAGYAVDRLGARRVAIVGAVVVTSCIAALSQINASIWSWWAVWAVVAIGALCTKPMVWTSAVSSLFNASRGLALAVALCGTAVASTFAPAYCNWLISNYGWRVGYLGLAGILAAVVIPALVLFFTSAIDEQRISRAKGKAQPALRLTGMSAREGLTSFRYIRLTIAATIMVFTAVSCLINLVPILVASDHPRATAAGVASLAGLSTIVGRLTTGYLIDRINANIVAGVSVALPIIAFLLLLFAPGQLWAAAVAALILGLSIGAELDSVAYLTTRHFGVKSFGVLFAITGACLGIASSGGPTLANFVYDQTHSYVPMLWAYMPLCALGSFLFFTLGAYPDFDSVQAGSPAKPLAAE